MSSSAIKVLLAEPNDLMGKILSERLKQEQLEVYLAKDGLHALEIMKTKAVDVVVAEELLPYKNGIELIRNANELNIPIIIISDADLEEKIMEAFELGASDFIDKPFSPNELLVRVKNVIKKTSK